MKTCKIKLRQVDGSTFRVESFSNTVELHIGQHVSRATVQAWTAMARVYVDVLGMVKAQEEAPSLQLEDGEPITRIDALAVAHEAEMEN